MASPAFPEPPPTQPATPISELDAIVEALGQASARWVETGLEDRISILRRCMSSLEAVSQDWAHVGARASGGEPGTAISGEILLGGPVVTMRHIRLLADSLEAIAGGGEPQVPGRSTRPDGQEVVQVFPTDWMDGVLFSGFKGEVWVQRGKPSTLGGLYRDKAEGRSSAGGVALVLGAGNVSSIGPLDVIHKLFIEDEVVVLKTNPVNAYLGPVYEQAFSPLIEAGLMAIVHGGAEVGSYLCGHSGIRSIHITGSDRTHDAIVWGSGREEQERRKASNDPVCDKPITSELGCVTPVLVVPGPWSESDIEFQAKHVAGMIAHNSSFNCNAAKVLLLPKRWSQRDAFAQKLREVLAHTEPRKAYYPGSQDRYAAFREKYPQCIPLTEGGEEVVPWTVIPDVQAEKGEYALTQEAFCGIVAEVDIDAGEADEYLEKAVAFANDCIWGTLSCMMLVHPKTQKAHPDAVDSAISALKYGGIGINVWAGVIYGLGCTSWGAYPGHDTKEIVSGIGTVHNTYLVDHPEKAVLRAPFRINPKPVWFPDHSNLPVVGRRMLGFEHAPSAFKLPGIALAALQG